jgi:hypothetical protein
MLDLRQDLLNFASRTLPESVCVTKVTNYLKRFLFESGSTVKS